MRSATLSCLGAMLGVVVGGLLLFLAGVFLAPSLSPGVASYPVPTSARASISVAASAEYVTPLLRQAIMQTGFAQQATVSLAAPNLVRISAQVPINVLGQRVVANVNLSSSLSVQGGRVLLKIEQVDSGGVNVPLSVLTPQVEPIRAQVEQQANTLAQNALQGTALTIANIRVAPDALTVELSSR